MWPPSYQKSDEVSKDDNSLGKYEDSGERYNIVPLSDIAALVLDMQGNNYIHLICKSNMPADCPF